MFVCLCVCGHRTAVLSQTLGFNISSLSLLNANASSPGERFLHVSTGLRLIYIFDFLVTMKPEKIYGRRKVYMLNYILNLSWRRFILIRRSISDVLLFLSLL